MVLLEAAVMMGVANEDDERQVVDRRYVRLPVDAPDRRRPRRSHRHAAARRKWLTSEQGAMDSIPSLDGARPNYGCSPDGIWAFPCSVPGNLLI